QVVMDFGEAQGLRLFRDIVASNGMSVRKGHSLLTNLVAAGEVPLALTVYGFLGEQAKVGGAPPDLVVVPPAIARATAEGLARNAPHPYAAVLFFDFLIGDEGQQILDKRQFVTVSRSIETPFNQGPLQLIDSAMILDQARKWQDLFQKTIVAPSREQRLSTVRSVCRAYDRSLIAAYSTAAFCWSRRTISFCTRHGTI